MTWLALAVLILSAVLAAAGRHAALAEDDRQFPQPLNPET